MGDGQPSGDDSRKGKEPTGSDASPRPRLLDARERFRQVAADVRHRMRAQEGSTEPSPILQHAKAGIGTSVDQLQEGYQEVQHNLDEMIENTGDAIRENPGRSLLIAVIAGFVLGLLVYRGNRDDLED